MSDRIFALIRCFMLLGGPLVGLRDVLLIVRAADEAERRLTGAGLPDCQGLLRTRRINPWQLRLGSLGDP